MAMQPMTEARPTLIALAAEIDASNAGDVRSQIITAALRPGISVVVADMTTTTFCDSSGVRALVLAHHQAARDGVALRLLRPGSAVRHVLELTGTDQMLTICQSLEDATMP